MCYHLHNTLHKIIHSAPMQSTAAHPRATRPHPPRGTAGVTATSRPSSGWAEPPLPLAGDADRYDHREGNDDYTQAGDPFRLFDDD